MASKEMSPATKSPAKSSPSQQSVSDTSAQQQIPAATATLVQTGQRDPQSLTPADVLQLQRTVGNGAVLQLMNAHSPDAKDQATLSRSEVIQRDPDDEAKKGRVLAKKTSANTFDLKWGHIFDERMSSYKQVIDRISGGFNAASKGFTDAHVAQAQADAIKLQLIMAALTIGLAAGFEPVFSGMLGNFNPELTATEEGIKKITGIVEKAENPVNAAASGAVNVAGAVNSAANAQPPAAASNNLTGGAPDALGYLTSNSQLLEQENQKIHQSFVTRLTNEEKMTDDQWEQYDVAAQGAEFQQLVDRLNSKFNDISKMKSDGEVAVILEKYMWATYIKQNMMGGEIDNVEQYKNLGSYIEDRLNALGIPAEAGVKRLSGHWYIPNSGGANQKLFDWATKYRDTLLGGGG